MADRAKPFDWAAAEPERQRRCGGEKIAVLERPGEVETTWSGMVWSKWRLEPKAGGSTWEGCQAAFNELASSGPGEHGFRA